MILHTEKILTYCTDADYDSFSSDSLLTEACVFNLSQLGELTTKLSTDFLQQHPDLPWMQMKGLRNKIVHDYEGVNLVLVWEIISSDLPELREQLKSLQASL